MNIEEPKMLNNYTLILLSQMAAGEWCGPAALTQWFTNEPQHSSGNFSSDIGINERRRHIIGLAATIYSSIEEWAVKDHNRPDVLFWETPGWGDWDFGFVPRLVEEALNSCGIHNENCELLDKNSTWMDIHKAIEDMCADFRVSNEEVLK